VLGNNDYAAGAPAVTRALENAGFQVLENRAVSIGTVALGGLDGRIHHGREWNRFRKVTYGALARTAGLEVLVAHRPDEFVLAPASVGLVLAGHTHCGQIVLPVVGALATGSDYGSKYLCGVIRDGSKLLVVTGGLGTSHVPLRYGAPPDLWLITIGGSGERSRALHNR
jgi:predicted MPP superfamily phosphohydrolase